MNLIKTKDGKYINADMVECFLILPLKGGYNVEARMPCYSNDECAMYTLGSYDSKEEAQDKLDDMAKAMALPRDTIIRCKGEKKE